ncbi:uncharacterized protein LOC127800741 [Diospyros lotus]|uniref:uncharacterized protein LOC127800741 n=1 Tax=Diospyros lotus TaxID=55363 RepID=UPI00224E2318|nr:uncharacterized protein LOC127800741 [Diospyros lotus]
MKTLVITASSSVKSTATTMDESRSETRDTFYFPGCRKDANCNCEMCLASINATLDLIPASSLTKLSASKPVPRTPISFNPSVISTPTSSNSPRILVSPPFSSTARMIFRDKTRRKKRELSIGFLMVRLVLGLSLVFSADGGFSWAVSKALKPELSPEIVRNLGEKSWVSQNLTEKLELLQKELQSLTNGKVSDCSSTDSLWKIHQDGLLLNSECTLYKSATEEVSIWGWPLQTAGLLTAEFSSRSFTILSGRVTEWVDGKVSYSTRKANQSWLHQKWSASAVQLDQKTWILEYKHAGVLENSRLISAALEFLKFRLSREVKRMNQGFWLLPASEAQENDFVGFRVPT